MDVCSASTVDKITMRENRFMREIIQILVGVIMKINVERRRDRGKPQMLTVWIYGIG